MDLNIKSEIMAENYLIPDNYYSDNNDNNENNELLVCAVSEETGAVSDVAESECEDIRTTKHRDAIFVDVLVKYKCLLDKSQTRAIKRAKQIALKNMRDTLMSDFEISMTCRQIKKKIENLKARLKTDNRKKPHQYHEKVFLSLMDMRDTKSKITIGSTVITRKLIPRAHERGQRLRFYSSTQRINTSQHLKTYTKRTTPIPKIAPVAPLEPAVSIGPIYVPPIPASSLLEEPETDIFAHISSETPETVNLTTPELQRLVLLEQRLMNKKQLEVFARQNDLIAVQLEVANLQKAKLTAEITTIKTEFDY